MKKDGIHVLVDDFMAPDEAMVCTREAIMRASDLEDLVEKGVITEGEAKEELELWLFRELEAGRNPAVLVTGIGQEP